MVAEVDDADADQWPSCGAAMPTQWPKAHRVDEVGADRSMSGPWAGGQTCLRTWFGCPGPPGPPSAPLEVFAGQLAQADLDPGFAADLLQRRSHLARVAADLEFEEHHVDGVLGIAGEAGPQVGDVRAVLRERSATAWTIPGWSAP